MVIGLRPWLLFLAQGVSVRWYLQKCDYCPVLLEAKVCGRIAHGYLVPERRSVCSGPCLFCLCQMGCRELEALCGLWWPPQLTQGSSSRGNWSSEFVEIQIKRETKSLLDFFNADMKKYSGFNSLSLKLCIQNTHKLEFDYSDESIRRK